MRGNTTTIDFRTLRIQWDSHSSMAAICTHWTITRDQLIRLRDVIPLPKRHDRSLRFKPKRSDQCDPTEDEIWNRLVFKIQASWTDEQELARRVVKPQVFSVRVVETPDDMRDYLDDVNRDGER
jgi:hypothetical protein